MFHFRQKTADITVFPIFQKKKKIKFRIFRKIEPIRKFGQLHWIQRA